VCSVTAANHRTVCSDSPVNTPEFTGLLQPSYSR
jgi:hypothetical protein